MTPNKKIILITGAAGFIGSSIAQKLLLENYHVIGIDNINSYYDVSLKQARLNKLYEKSTKRSIPFENHQINIENSLELEAVFSGKSSSNEYFKSNRPTKVVNFRDSPKIK